MKKALLIGILLIIAAAGSVNTATTTSAADPAQTTRLMASFPNIQLPGRYYDLNQNIGEFAPGAALPLQSCACEIYFTVIEGDLTVTIGSKTEVYVAGKGAYIPAGIMNQPVNNGTKQARVFYTMLQLARGSDDWQFTQSEGAPKPSLMPKFVGWSTVLGLYSAEGKATVIQSISDWDSGFKTPVHMMNHEHVFSVLEGENTFRYRDGAVETYRAGQKAVMTKGRVGTMENSGGANNRMAISWVITSSAPPVSPA